MNRNVVVIGTQWGDEGKGKIVDLLTDHVSAVVRFQGGHNAGHPLVIGKEKTAVVGDITSCSTEKPLSDINTERGSFVSPRTRRI